MTGSNKILTVSYGTFSCTLEGFDEPFDAMRGIAEYFRDLAADDRYFGAEPPTPDAEMLQSIAQREVNRRVEARTSETGIALTQALSQAKVVEPAAEPPSAPAPTTPEPEETFDQGPLAFDDEYLMSDEPEDILTVDDSVPPAEETERVETVAEKLRRIRAVVSRSIEPGDAPNSFSQAPAADSATGATAKRDRANTETINDIAAGLSDEDVFDDESDFDDVDDAAPLDLDDSFVSEEDVDDLQRIDGADENAFAVSDEDETNEQEDDGADESLIANVLSQSADDQDSYDSAEADPAPSKSAVADTEENVDRLLKETDQQFADDAGIRRRRVISQMRAAVAATKAERVVTPARSKTDEDAQEASPYRDDLKRAITRPVTPSTTEAPKAPERTQSAKPPPLVLVSSQRVDDVADDDAEKAEDNDIETGNFRDFARDMGANELPDLMEAAAAYTSFVEGQSHFSRPEIMKRVAAADPALEISREAGLRSFGQLLRQGKIRKLDRGQFVIDEDTRFNPGQRIAGE